MSDHAQLNETEIWREVASLERALLHDPTVSPRLASALLDAADECRSLTRNQVREITSEAQLDACERAARRALELAAEPAVHDRARALLAEVTLGRRWSWQPGVVPMLLAAVAVCAGLGGAAYGGIEASLSLVAVSAAVSSVALFLLVLLNRKQNWRVRAVEIDSSVWRRGI
ncbi:hypothetical protein [Alloactinosynnema sp. L-07]|uniref:hypothetical protein n=1 Tax=Alloactinosynnema sp. L-07 TaxID=1653480 RepID=UPI00065F0075|nr:hypothetical protein [Alloactinosynnema sp. L-07]CRK59152.1 hypothetical protein [Alloactinosynnema sp. L-07]